MSCRAYFCGLLVLVAVPASSAAQRELDSALARLVAVDGPGLVVGISRNGTQVEQLSRGLARLGTTRPLTATTPIYVASLTKTFTAAGIARLVEQGKLRFDDPMERYLPELGVILRGATIRQVLTHTSGLPDHLAGRTDSVAGWTNRDVLRWLLAHPSETTPRGAVRYSNSGYVLLATVIERVAGISYAEFLNREFLGPLGMTSTGVITRDDPAPGALARSYRRVAGAWRELPYDAFTYGAGGMYSTVEDLLRWGNGVLEGRVVGDSLLPRITTDNPTVNGRATAYGLGWLAVQEGGMGVALTASGGLGGYQGWMSLIPGRRAVVVILANGGEIPRELFGVTGRRATD